MEDAKTWFSRYYFPRMIHRRFQSKRGKIILGILQPLRASVISKVQSHKHFGGWHVIKKYDPESGGLGVVLCHTIGLALSLT